MNNTKIYIVPIIIDIKTGKYYTVVIDNPNHTTGISLPFFYNDYQSDIDLLVKKCILEYININPNWLKINLYNKIRNSDNNLEIFYYFSAPYEQTKVSDPSKAAIINFDVLCLHDPFFCNLKYFI